MSQVRLQLDGFQNDFQNITVSFSGDHMLHSHEPHTSSQQSQFHALAEIQILGRITDFCMAVHHLVNDGTPDPDNEGCSLHYCSNAGASFSCPLASEEFQFKAQFSFHLCTSPPRYVCIYLDEVFRPMLCNVTQYIENIV